MNFFIVIAILCSVLYCKGQVVVVDDTVAFSTFADNAPYTSISECNGIPCPAGTIHCSTRSETSLDFTKWVTTVECSDYYGNVLNSAVQYATVPSVPFYGGRYNYGSDGYNDDANYYSGDSY